MMELLDATRRGDVVMVLTIIVNSRSLKRLLLVLRSIIRLTRTKFGADGTLHRRRRSTLYITSIGNIEHVNGHDDQYPAYTC